MHPGVPRLVATCLLAVALLATPAISKGQEEAEAQDAYPPGSATADLSLEPGASTTVEVTPKLALSFVAADTGARLNVTVTVKWKAAGLPEPLPEVPGALSYIHVAGQEDGIAQVRFDCLVDPAFQHDLRYWDGEAWTSLSASEGQRIVAQGDGAGLQVLEAGEAGGHFVAVVDHASAFALTSMPPPSPDDERGTPGIGALASLAMLGLAVTVAATSRWSRRR